jgi:nucleotide-binding universal stress UspA family protein
MFTFSAGQGLLSGLQHTCTIYSRTADQLPDAVYWITKRLSSEALIAEVFGPQVKCELVVAVGDPREQVSKYVTQHPVDMVVLGSRGMGNCKHSE